jgi:flagellar basal-body rod modification protein FlgD
MNQGQMMTATGFIGRDVVFSGNQVTKFNDEEGNVYTTKVYYTFEEDVAAHQVTILDGSNNIVYYKELGAHMKGTDNYPWDGKDMNGKEVAAGVYQIYISAQDANGKTVLSNQQFSARVLGVMNEDGVYKLALDGGRIVPLTDVTTVTNPTQSSGGDGSSSSSTSSGTTTDPDDDTSTGTNDSSTG